jgi:hypothetical protein
VSSYREAGHLPNLRGAADPPDPAGIPRQRRGRTPQMHGRYPDYDVLAEQDHWDEVTRRVVLDRLERVPEIRFFTEAEAETLGVFCDVVTAQDGEPRIPLLAYVDEKLHDGKLDGFQYEGMPDDRDTWRVVARGLDEEARLLGAASFAELEPRRCHDVCRAFSEGRLRGEAWAGVDQKTAWKTVMRSILQAFYSHPWAWNEIGFGGPAYPRGYARLGVGLRESWEGEEQFDVDPVRDVQERGVDR